MAPGLLLCIADYLDVRDQIRLSHTCTWICKCLETPIKANHSLVKALYKCALDDVRASLQSPFVSLKDQGLLAMVTRPWNWETDGFNYSHLLYFQDGSTVLLHAAHRGEHPTVESFLSVGAFVNAKNRDGFTALHIATQGGESHIVRVFLANRSYINEKTDDGFTALHLAIMDDGSNWGLETEHIRLEVVTALLATRPLVDVKNKQGLTALHLAIQKMSPAYIVTILLFAGPDINLRNNDGLTALQLAMQLGSIYALNMLKLSG